MEFFCFSIYVFSVIFNVFFSTDFILKYFTKIIVELATRVCNCVLWYTSTFSPYLVQYIYFPMPLKLFR